jgi:tryptophanyl-tRNA synthetase
MNASSRKTLLSAVTPSNRVTIGNYIGALRNWVELQDRFDCLFFSTDLHAITVRQEPAALQERTLHALALYIASGINPEKATLFIQSHVPEHAELTWVLTCFSSMGELNRMTQFKDKSSKAGTHIGTGLFTYPLLMAADILLYQTHLVPVGEDQKQHVELTRDLALRMRNLFGEDLFTVPEPYIPPVGARIMSLQNPSAKMSKSDSDPHATVFMDDPNDVIVKKFKRAVTDSGTEITWDDSKPGVKNLLTIQAALTGKAPAELVAAYAGKMYGHLKVDTAELVVQTLGPVRDEAARLIQEKSFLEGVLRRGAERARERAAETLQRVYERVGFIPPFVNR